MDPQNVFFSTIRGNLLAEVTARDGELKPGEEDVSAEELTTFWGCIGTWWCKKVIGNKFYKSRINYLNWGTERTYSIGLIESTMLTFWMLTETLEVTETCPEVDKFGFVSLEEVTEALCPSSVWLSFDQAQWHRWLNETDDLMNQRSRENRNCETKLRWYQLTTERVDEETRAEALNPHNTLTVQANTDPRNTNRNSENPETLMSLMKQTQIA